MRGVMVRGVGNATNEKKTEKGRAPIKATDDWMARTRDGEVHWDYQNQKKNNGGGVLGTRGGGGKMTRRGKKLLCHRTETRGCSNKRADEGRE